MICRDRYTRAMGERVYRSPDGFERMIIQRHGRYSGFKAHFGNPLTFYQTMPRHLCTGGCGQWVSSYLGDRCLCVLAQPQDPARPAPVGEVAPALGAAPPAPVAPAPSADVPAEPAAVGQAASAPALVEPACYAALKAHYYERKDAWSKASVNAGGQPSPAVVESNAAVAAARAMVPFHLVG